MLITALLLSVLAHPTAFGQSGSIGGKPANPDASNPRTQSIFVKTLAPGTIATDALEVVNNTGETKRISVYSVDSVPSSGGAFACAQAVDTPVGVGKWVTMSETSVMLPANEKKIVPFTITVPLNAEVGEQNGCIVLQEEKEPSFQGGIGLSFRTAIRVAVLVPGDIRKELSAHDIAVSQRNDKLVITPRVRNTGNVSLDTKVQVKLDTIFTTTVAQQNNTYPVLRAQETEWNFEFNKPFWGGFYTASYSLTYNDNEKAFLGGEQLGSSLKTVAGSRTTVFVAPHPLALLLELAVLAAITAAAIAYRKRKQYRWNVVNTWEDHTVKKSEQLHDIAKNRNTSWKKLANANRIKAPYHLKAGQKIKIPPLHAQAKRSTPKKS